MLSYESVTGKASATSKVVSTTAPSGAQTVISYALNQKSVTEPDNATVKRRFTSDALDRLTSVAEEPNGANDVTSYTYDGEGRLKSVTQGTQPSRLFTYDLADRLQTAQNPESGTITYAYDLNGNMIRRLDALGVVACFGILNGTTCDASGYDALNRPTLKSYSVPSTVASTPTVVSCYDGQTYSGGACTGSLVGAELGQLTSVGNTQSSTDYAHDMAGRLVASTQRTAGLDDRPFSYRHFAGDAGGEVVYPSERRVVTCPDALQRVAWVSGSKTYEQCRDGASVAASEAYASGLQYWPHGGLKQMTLGNGLVENASFNLHLQPERLRLGTTAQPTTNCGASGDTWCVELGYGSTATVNNGNLRTQSIWSKKSSGTQLQLGQSYDYDLRNRLTTFSESVTAGGAGGGNWTETNGYDRWSNRWATGTYVGTRTPSSSAQIDAATNRVTQTASGAVTYNAAGNLTEHTGWGTFTYDAENRLVASGTATYVYDGEGRRVKKSDGATTTYYVYDGAGSLMAEYGGSANPVGGTRYVTVDHLGSTRVTTDASGAVKMRCDYKPFGEQIAAVAAQGNRNLIAEYACAEAPRRRSLPARNGTQKPASITSSQGTSRGRKADSPAPIRPS